MSDCISFDKRNDLKNRKTVESHVELLKVILMNSHTPDRRHDAQEHVLRTVENKLKEMVGLSVDEAKAIATLLTEAPLEEVQKARAVDMIRDKVTSADIGKTGTHTSMQRLEGFERFLTAADWKVLLEGSVGLKYKLQALASRCNALALGHPTETTVRDIVAIAFITADAVVAAGPQALDAIKSFKAMLHRKKYSPMVVEYPQDPRGLLQSHADLYMASYRGADPVECPLPSAQLADARSRMPCRCTKQGFQALTPQPSQPVRPTMLALGNQPWSMDAQALMHQGLFQHGQPHQGVVHPWPPALQVQGNPLPQPSAIEPALPPPAQPSAGFASAEPEASPVLALANAPWWPSGDSPIESLAAKMREALSVKEAARPASREEGAGDGGQPAGERVQGGPERKKVQKRPASSPASTRAAKRPASASASDPSGPKPSLRYPGTSHRPSFRYGTSRVCTDVERSRWRLYRRPGDKIEICYQWKSYPRPEDAWADCCKELVRLNP